MKETRIEIQRSRDIGEIIGTVFEIVRQNPRTLGMALLFLAAPLVLMESAVTATSTVGVERMFDVPFVSVGRTSTIQVLLVLLGLFASVLAAALANAYVLLYLDRPVEEITPGDLWLLVRTDFWSILGVTTASWFVVMAGFAFLFIPGVYLLVALVPVLMVRMREEGTVWSSITRSIELVRGYWWSTVGLLFVMGLIAGILSLMLDLPLSVAGYVAAALDIEGTSLYTVLVIVTGAISSAGSLATTLLFSLAAALHYFNLVERKEGAGMLEKIEMIGEQQIQEP